MASPSSQLISSWVKESLCSDDWKRLDEVCREVLCVRLKGASMTHIEDIVISNLSYVAEHLRNDVATAEIDGAPIGFEIDEEDSPPYLRLADGLLRPLLDKLRKLDPFDFEKICAAILSRLGAQADVTKRTNDDGVDFWAIDFDFVPDGIRTPLACRAAVIGQAKRYKEGNFVRETDVRAFIGGAIKVKHDLAQQQKILPLSPVVFAFWTTSDFDNNAKSYARGLGLWYLGGLALARYIQLLDLELVVDDFLSSGLGKYA